MMNSVAILGSTGSIGTQAIEVAQKHGLRVTALAANTRVDALVQQAKLLKPELLCIADESRYPALKEAAAGLGCRLLAGMDGLCEIAQHSGSEILLNSVVGMVGLLPTLTAISAKKPLALANKETLVAGGALVMDAAAANGVPIFPVDSEHSAIFQSLQGCPDKKEVKRLILTASGGPFFGKKRSELAGVTVEQALRHPNWSMGAKITIDSATMMNKGLELIEAVWLFDMPPKDIDIVVHRQSVIHSLVEYCDNSVIAQLGVPDMRIPIQYALTYPHRIPSPVRQLSLTEYGTLTFETPDYETFGCISICREAVAKGGLYPAAANGANEAANAAFRQGKIGFLDIERLVGQAVAAAQSKEAYTLDDVNAVDRWAREFVLAHL